MSVSPLTRRPLRCAVAVAAAVGAVALVLPPTASAESAASAEPGNCPVKNDPSWSGWTDYAQLTRELEEIEKTSQGRVQVDVAGHTTQGRELYAARVGTGDRVLLVTSAIHGNERTGTEALLGILKDLGSSNDAASHQLLSEVTLVAMPMVNPDGGELNRRINMRSWDETLGEFPQLAGAPRAWYHSLTGDGIAQPGYDLNRDFNPDLDYTPRAADLPGKQTDAGFFLSPESRAVRDTYTALRDEKGAVDAYIDLHHMGPCERVTGGPQDGKLVTVSLDYPPLGVNDGAKYKKDWPKLDQDKSRRYAVTVANGVADAFGPQSRLASTARYYHPDAREYAGQGRSALALNGTGTVLFEVRGQQDDLGQTQKGMFVKAVRTGVESLLGGLASGTADTVNGDDFFQLPDYGWETTAD